MNGFLIHLPYLVYLFLLLKGKNNNNNNNINIIYIKGRRKGVAGVAILINPLGE